MAVKNNSNDGGPTPRRSIAAWFDIRGRKVGGWAFALNRLTALGLSFYLFLHLVVLTRLLQGEGAWNDFVDLVKSPFFLALDVVLLFGLIFHGLNGIRLSLVGLGIFSNKQGPLFWGLMFLGLLILITAGWLIFTV